MATARRRTKVGTVPAKADADNDSWAYTPEHLAAVKRSDGQPGYRASVEFMEALARMADAAAAEGRTLARANIEAFVAAEEAAGRIRKVSAVDE